MSIENVKLHSNIIQNTMPEGDTVLRTVDWLESLFIGNLNDYHLIGFKRFSKPAAGGKKAVVRFPLVKPSDLQPALDGKLVDIYCKGKFYFIELANDISIVAHHGLKGKWTLEIELNTQFEFIFAKCSDAGDIIPETEVKFYFSNILSGDFQILKTKAELQTKLNTLAPGFIGRDILAQADWLLRLNRFTVKKRLRDILFDQNAVCSGYGNFCIAELFYELRVHPEARLGDLDDVLKVEMYQAAKRIMVEFYEGTREKVVYKKKACPLGFQVVGLQVGSRVAWYVPELQLIGKP